MQSEKQKEHSSANKEKEKAVEQDKAEMQSRATIEKQKSDGQGNNAAKKKKVDEQSEKTADLPKVNKKPGAFDTTIEVVEDSDGEQNSNQPEWASARMPSDGEQNSNQPEWAAARMPSDGEQNSEQTQCLPFKKRLREHGCSSNAQLGSKEEERHAERLRVISNVMNGTNTKEDQKLSQSDAAPEANESDKGKKPKQSDAATEANESDKGKKSKQSDAATEANKSDKGKKPKQSDAATEANSTQTPEPNTPAKKLPNKIVSQARTPPSKPAAEPKTSGDKPVSEGEQLQSSDPIKEVVSMASGALDSLFSPMEVDEIDTGERDKKRKHEDDSRLPTTRSQKKQNARGLASQQCNAEAMSTVLSMASGGLEDLFS